MLKVDARERSSAQELLQHKILQLRGQDYAMRLAFSTAKVKAEKLVEESKKLDEKNAELSTLLRNMSGIEGDVESQLDQQITEMRARLKQLRMPDHSDMPQQPQRRSLFAFSGGDPGTAIPLQDIDYNTLHKRSVEIRRSFKGSSLLE